MNRDFSEMLSALSDAGVEYILVGAHAMAAHGLPRATGDMGLWVRPSPENPERVWRALAEFGAPLDQLSQRDLTEPEMVFQIGVVPNRIDLLTSVTGVDFEDAWTRREVVELDGIRVGVLAREDLIRNKKSVGRLRELADIEDLGRAWMSAAIGNPVLQTATAGFTAGAPGRTALERAWRLRHTEGVDANPSNPPAGPSGMPLKAIRILLITFVIAVGVPGIAPAQTGSTHSSRQPFETGRVEGAVYDSESREPLIGGMVLIEGTNLGNVTGDNGAYFVDHVPAGSYMISAEYLGYGTIRRSLDVSGGQTVSLDFALPSELVLANAITAVIEKEPIPVAEPVKEYSVTSEVQVNVPDALPEESCRAMVTVHGSYIVNGQWQLAASVGRLVCGNQEIVCQPIVVYKDPALNQAQIRNGAQAAPGPAEPVPPGDAGTDVSPEEPEPSPETAALR